MRTTYPPVVCGGMTAYECSEFLLQYLTRLPAHNSNLDGNELRQKACWVGVLRQLEDQGALMASTSKIANMARQRLIAQGVDVLQWHQLDPSIAESLEDVAEQLSRSYHLSEAELMQIFDLKVSQLVDLYTILEACSHRYDVEKAKVLLRKLVALRSFVSQSESLQAADGAQIEKADTAATISAQEESDEVIGAVPAV